MQVRILNTSRFLKDQFFSNLFVLALMTWFLRMVIPGVIYVFIPVFIALNLFFLPRFKEWFKLHLFFEWLKIFHPLIIMGVFYFIGIAISGKIYSINLKDLFELMINFLFLLLLFYIINNSRSKNTFHRIFQNITSVIGISSIFIAILGIIKFFLQFYFIDIIPLNTPFGSALNDDKNFYALYSFLGMISFYTILKREMSVKKRIITQLSLSVLLLNIILSFSVRSLFILGLIFLVLGFIQLKGILPKSSQHYGLIAKNLRLLSILLFLGICVLIFSSKLFVDFSEKHIRSNQIEISHWEEKDLADKAFNFQKWKYAIELYADQTFWKQLIGGGFHYFENFGQKFNDLESLSGYPHNPVLSSLLYSGFIGALFVLSFIIISFYYGIIYFKKYPLYSMMLFVSMMFVLFSGNSIFSVPIFLFLFSLSFVIRHQEITELHINENINKPGSKVLKEFFDYVLSTLLLIGFSPFLLIISFAILFNMGWPVIFSQQRVGQNGKLFFLHKFRTMSNEKTTTSVAAQEVNRITRLGTFLRKSKLDELPELINIIRGDMSFVGPRPDVEGYADKLEGEDRIILQLKPGLTGAASLKYKNEEELLIQQDNPQQYNDQIIFPDKVRINKEYMKKWTLWLDFKILIYTALGKKLSDDGIH